MEILKNIERSTVLTLKDMVAYGEKEVVSRTLSMTDGAGVTLFAFDAGEGISTHAAGGDALVQVLEGTGEFTIDGVPHTVHEGESIVMPVGIPHAVHAPERFKMLLTVVFPAGGPVK